MNACICELRIAPSVKKSGDLAVNSYVQTTFDSKHSYAWYGTLRRLELIVQVIKITKHSRAQLPTDLGVTEKRIVGERDMEVMSEHQA